MHKKSKAKKKKKKKTETVVAMQASNNVWTLKVDDLDTCFAVKKESHRVEGNEKQKTDTGLRKMGQVNS